MSSDKGIEITVIGRIEDEEADNVDVEVALDIRPCLDTAP